MYELYEAISELLCAQTTAQKADRAKDVRDAFDVVKARLEELNLKVAELEKDAAREKTLSGAMFGVLEYHNLSHSTRTALEMAYFSDVDVFAIDAVMQANGQ